MVIPTESALWERAVHSVYTACLLVIFWQSLCGFEDEMRNSIVLVPGHCFSFYFLFQS